MKAIYTEAAKSEIEAFKLRQQELVEELVSERKTVIGDEILEITASDVKAAERRIRVYRPNLVRNRLNDLVYRTYIFIGVLLMIGAFAYPKLLALYESNRTQALMFSMGAALATMGALFGTVTNYRKRRISAAAEYYRMSERAQMEEMERLVHNITAQTKEIEKS